RFTRIPLKPATSRIAGVSRPIANYRRCKMRRTAAARATALNEWQFLIVSRLKRTTFALLLSAVLGCLSIPGHAAGLDCPELGPGSVPRLLTDLQIKLVASADSADLGNEINDLINKLQILKPNISYAELTNVVIASFCPVVANMDLTASEKWDRMRQFDMI